MLSPPACCRIFFTNVSASLYPDLDAIVDGLNEVLLGAEVAFGGLDRSVAEQQLNLLQIPSRFATELGASAPQIVRR